MLGIAEKPELDHPASILYYKVEDIQAAHATLVDRGVTFDQAPVLVHKAADHDLWLAFFRDMDGNPLALISEVGHS
jgi:methylmalonyl-CoA/ethylmalonyl-CoA epimerase